MTKRKCDACGKMREVRRAKVCEKNDHFICSSCHSGFLGSRKTCPLCKSRLKYDLVPWQSVAVAGNSRAG